MKKTLLFFAAALLCGMLNAQSPIFYEDFSGVNTDQGLAPVPTGWKTISDGKPNHGQYNYTDSWAIAGLNGGMNAALSVSYLNPTDTCDRWLITPKIAIPSNITDSTLVFQITAYGYTDRYPETLNFYVSTTGNNKEDFTTKIGEIPALGQSNGGLHTFTIDSVEADSIYIAIVNNGYDGYYVMVLDVAVVLGPNNGMELDGISAPLFTTSTSGSFDIIVTNTGMPPLTSYDYSYTVNGETTTGTIENINVAYDNSYKQTVRYSDVPTGILTITATVGNPNGTDETVSESDSAFVNIMSSEAASTQRMTLLEHFTTAQCGYCPGGHERLGQAMNGYDDKIAWVAHHSGFGTDDLTTETSYYLEVLYGGSTFAPAMCIDRSRAFVTTSGDDPDAGVVTSVGQVSSISSKFATATATPAYATIDMNYNYDPQTRALSVTVSGQFTTDLGLDMPMLNVFLTEDSLVMDQANYDASGNVSYNYVHNHAMRENLTNEIFGDNTPFTTTNSGDTYSKTYTITLDRTYRANKCRLIAFVSNMGNSFERLNVLNATKSDFLLQGPDPTCGIAAVDGSINVKTYPNPASNVLNVTVGSTIRSISIVNTLGQSMVNENNVNADIYSLNVEKMPAGVYFITVTTDNGTGTERVSIVH